MIIMHNKTGNLYQLIDDECKVKINGKWVDAVIYQGKDKETGRIKCFIREKSDFDSHFTMPRILTTDLDGIDMVYKICLLKKVAEEYPGKTLEDIIAQLKARRKKISN